MAVCKSCGAPVIFAIGASGKPNPIDAEPVSGGNVRLIAQGDGEPPVARYDRKDDQPSLDDDGIRYVSHFSTCPHSAQWRKRG